MAQRKRKTAVKHIDSKLTALRSDLDELQDHMKGIVGGVGNVANDSTQAAIQTARDVAERAYRLAEEAATNAAEEVEVWATDNLESVRESVRTQPFYAMALVMGAGLFLGAFLSRR